MDSRNFITPIPSNFDLTILSFLPKMIPRKILTSISYQNSMAEMRGTCIVCEFQVRGDTLDELDINFTSHFENTGHETYFFMDGDKRMERSVS